MNNGDRYVVYSQDTLYRISNSSCSEGDTVNLNNTQVTRFRFINGRLIAQDVTTVGNYGTNSYICHVWNSDYTYQLDVNYVILPATLLIFGLFWFLYKILWGARR